MQTSAYIIIALILSGAAILLLALYKTRKILSLLAAKAIRKRWRNLTVLMAFFFFGYLCVILIVLGGHISILQVLIGVIFFAGAVFVYLVVITSLGTFERLHEANKVLEKNVLLLKTQNEELKQFNYATSHDLQEPINTVTGFTSLLKEEYGEKLDDEANLYIHFMSQAAVRMKELISSLVDYLKIGRDEKLETVKLNDLLTQVIDEMQGSIQESEAEITVGKLPILEVSAVDIKRLFQNLLSNAIKYRRSDVKLEVDIVAMADNLDGSWTFMVQDNGIGIPEKQYDRIFKIFKQLHHRDEYEGMGIGMSICKKIVEMHGGSIWLESEEGVGTKFYFTLREH